MAARRPLVRQGGGSRQLAAGDTLDDAVLSPRLRNLAGLSPTANQLPYFTGAEAYALTSLTVYGRQLIGAADNAAARAILSLGNSATRDVTTGPNDTTSERLIRTNDWVKQTSMYDATPGSLLLVGAFGYGVSGIPSGQYAVDADALTVGGKYAVGATWVGSPFSGTAGANQGSLEHIVNFQTSTYAMQRWSSLTLTTAIHKVRSKVNGVWSPWVDLVTGEKVISATDPVTGRIWVGGPNGMFGIGGVATAKAGIPETEEGMPTQFFTNRNAVGANNPYPAGYIAGVHINYSATYAVQFVGAVTSNRFFARNLNNGAWAAPVELFHTGNFDPATKANLASPPFTGTPTTPTPPVGDNSTRVSNTAHVNAAIAAAIAAAPAPSQDYAALSKSGFIGPISYCRTASGSAYSFMPTWDDSKALVGNRLIGPMQCSSSGTAGAGSSASIDTDYLTLTTGTVASGGCGVFTAENSQSLQVVNRIYPDSSVTNIRNLWFSGAFRMPAALSSAAQRYTLAMGVNTTYSNNGGGSILVQYTDSVNSGRPFITYMNAANSAVTVNSTLVISASDVIAVTIDLRRNSSGVASITVVIRNVTQGTSYTHNATNTALIYNSADPFPPNVSQSKMTFSIQKSIGTAAVSVNLFGMVTGFNWIAPLSEWL